MFTFYVIFSVPYVVFFFFFYFFTYIFFVCIIKPKKQKTALVHTKNTPLRPASSSLNDPFLHPTHNTWAYLMSFFVSLLLVIGHVGSKFAFYYTWDNTSFYKWVTLLFLMFITHSYLSFCQFLNK